MLLSFNIYSSSWTKSNLKSKCSKQMLSWCSHPSYWHCIVVLRFVFGGALEGKQGWVTSQFALSYAQTYHLSNVKGVCIVHKGTRTPYFVNYHIDHAGKTKILFRKRWTEVCWKENKDESILIYSAMYLSASREINKRCLYHWGKDVASILHELPRWPPLKDQNLAPETMSGGALEVQSALPEYTKAVANWLNDSIV